MSRFFCHTCSVETDVDAELKCTTCNGEFVEELAEEEVPEDDEWEDIDSDEESQEPPRGSGYVSGPGPLPPPLNPMAQFLNPFFGGAPAAASAQAHHHHHHHQHYHAHAHAHAHAPYATGGLGGFLQQLLGGLGVPGAQINIQPVGAGPFAPFMGAMGGGIPLAQIFGGLGGFGIPGMMGGNMGDFVADGNLESVIERLMQQYQGRIGTPPAAKSAVDALRKLKADQAMIDAETECTVCLSRFELHEECLEMPCVHKFHDVCLLPWLKLHNQCPTCRCELKTEDPHYEAHRAERDRQSRPSRPPPSSGFSPFEDID